MRTIPLKIILVGAGGWGQTWGYTTLLNAEKEGIIRVVAAVSPLKESMHYLSGIYDGIRLFTDLDTALDSVSADACVVAAPPECRLEIVSKIADHGLHILCEKPIASSFEEAVKILDTVKKSGIKAGVTMTHRFSKRIKEFIDAVKEGGFGRLDYITLNFNWNRRDGLSKRQSEMDYNPLIEGAVHHFEILRAIASSECTKIYADCFTPPYANYKKGGAALMNLGFENGVRALYETSWCNATTQNGWGSEYIRAELEKATVVLKADEVRVYLEKDNKNEDDRNFTVWSEAYVGKFGNDYLLDRFVAWVNGGCEMETSVYDNIRTLACVFAAVESAESGLPAFPGNLIKKWL